MNAKEVLKLYMEEGLPDFVCIELKDINQKGNLGDTPLHVASVRGRMDEVEALLVAGAVVNVQDDSGYTPLHDAAGQGHMEVVKKLLEYGASIEMTNAFGETARDVATQMKHQDIVAVLKNKCNLPR